MEDLKQHMQYTGLPGVMCIEPSSGACRPGFLNIRLHPADGETGLFLANALVLFCLFDGIKQYFYTLETDLDE